MFELLFTVLPCNIALLISAFMVLLRQFSKELVHFNIGSVDRLVAVLWSGPEDEDEVEIDYNTFLGEKSNTQNKVIFRTPYKCGYRRRFEKRRRGGVKYTGKREERQDTHTRGVDESMPLST